MLILTINFHYFQIWRPTSSSLSTLVLILKIKIRDPLLSSTCSDCVIFLFKIFNGYYLWSHWVFWDYLLNFRDTFIIMQVADRPGDISILTHIFVSDNRTVVNSFGAPKSWDFVYIGNGSVTYEEKQKSAKKNLSNCHSWNFFF